MGENTMIVPKLEVEGIVFPPVVCPPGSSKTLFLGGAGRRGMEIGGKFITFTAIGVYLEDAAVDVLAGKWKGKTADELAGNVDFYREIVAGPFEKFTKVTMVLPLTGEQYSEKVTENCVAHWKASGVYTENEAAAVKKFKEIFKAETFPPGASILFTHSPSGSLTIGFSKDGSIPTIGVEVVDNKALSDAILESIIGEHGVSPAAKQSLAFRVSEILEDARKEEMLAKEPIAISV
uniref:Chalcone-flavonone isomerase family protein n=1 Tax=Tricyrtis sp. Shinonome TaxID=1354217 RepID=W6JMJ6_9LILI|nr:chalcone isomerase [Tricyrtis sp. Shinonome]